MPKILVLDDEPDILLLVETILKTNGYEVQKASSKIQFLELLSWFKPDLVIIDVMLSGDDGRDICREIKAAEHSHIPVILYSADNSLLENYKECNADYTLDKPFEINVLLDKVKIALLSAKNKYRN